MGTIFGNTIVNLYGGYVGGNYHSVRIVYITSVCADLCLPRYLIEHLLIILIVFEGLIEKYPQRKGNKKEAEYYAYRPCATAHLC